MIWESIPHDSTKDPLGVGSVSKLGSLLGSFLFILLGTYKGTL